MTFLILSMWLSALFFFLCYLDKIVGNVINDLVYHALGLCLSLSLSFSFPFVRGRVLSATSSPPHMIVFSTLPCLLSSSSLPPLLPSSHLSQHSPPISALASLVSYCPPHVTLPLSSVVCHPPSFLRVLSGSAHCSLLLTNLSVKLLCTPVCPRYSCYFSYPVVFAQL